MTSSYFIIGKKVDIHLQGYSKNTQVAMCIYVKEVAMLWRKDSYMYFMLASKEMVLPLTALSTEQEQKLNA